MFLLKIQQKRYTTACARLLRRQQKIPPEIFRVIFPIAP